MKPLIPTAGSDSPVPELSRPAAKGHKALDPRRRAHAAGKNGPEADENSLEFAAALGQLMGAPAHSHRAPPDLPKAPNGHRAGHDHSANAAAHAAPPPLDALHESLARRSGLAARDMAHLDKRRAHGQPANDENGPSSPQASPDAAAFARQLTDDVKNVAASAAPTQDAPAVASVLPAEALQDDSIRGAVMTNAAHLHLETGSMGELGLHVRIREGVAEVRLDGAAAPVLKAREPELREALAAEGVRLGQLAVGASNETGNQTTGDDPRRQQRDASNARDESQTSREQRNTEDRSSSQRPDPQESQGSSVGPRRAIKPSVNERTEAPRRMRAGRHHVDA